MKPIILPITALIAVGVWHFVNAHKITQLKESLNEAEGAVSRVSEPSLNRTKGFMVPGEGVDLERIGGFFSDVAKGEIECSGGNAWLWTEQQLALMSGDRLVTLLEELKEADFPSHERSMMKSKIRYALQKNSPETYLEHEGVIAGYNNFSGSLAFKKFIDHDMARALAWFDEYVQKTNLGENEAPGISSARVAFEKIIAQKYYPGDLDSLKLRFENLRVDQVSLIIDSLDRKTGEKIPEHYFELARSSLPEEEASTLIGYSISYLSRNRELSEITEIIGGYQLTESERSVCYRGLASNLAFESRGHLEKLETLIPFLREQGVEAIDEIYADGVAYYYRDELRGAGQLNEVYQYVRDVGVRENLDDLFTKFVRSTTSHLCHCCSLSGRLMRISDESLKREVADAYHSSLNLSQE